jgi:hypothetical protein
MAAARLRAALGDGNLREAAKQLKAITPDSVYLSTATETWRAAETRAAEDAGRKAQGMASAHDCAGLRRFQAQVGATSTPSVIAGVAAVKCVERVASTSPPEPGPARTPVGAGSDTSQGSSTPSKSSICDTMNVDDVILRAQNQFTAGYPRSALSTLTKALTCRSDLRMLRMAALYACAAHDGEAARLYYGKVPAQFQPAVLQRCQAENVPLAP